MLKKVAEWHDINPVKFRAEVYPLGQPAILRGVVRHWPAVATKSPKAFCDYVRRFDSGRPVGLLTAPPGVEGQFFYREDMRGFNFERRKAGLGPALAELLALLDVAEAPLADLVRAATGGRPVDVVIEATGYPPAILDGLSVLKKGGVLVVAGIHPGPVSLPLTDFVRARQQLRATHGCDRSTWDKVLTVMGQGPERFRPMITHRMPLSHGLEGFELSRQRAASKVMLQP